MTVTCGYFQMEPEKPGKSRTGEAVVQPPQRSQSSNQNAPSVGVDKGWGDWSDDSFFKKDTQVRSCDPWYNAI